MDLLTLPKPAYLISSTAPPISLSSETADLMTSESAPPVSKPRVLVIDDDFLIADTLAMVLRRFGFDAVVSYSGDHAVELARVSPFSAIISDVMMEPMNGIQAAVAIRALCPDCKILLMSGNERTAALMAQAARDGFHFDILAKPVHPTVILDALRPTSQVDTPRSELPLFDA
jgi:DNA-binding NtrC family response regulator